MSDAWLAEYVKTFGGSCPLCRTPLLPGNERCTRCRSELRLGLKVLEAYLLAWGVALGAAAITSGFGLFMLLLFLRRPHLSNERETVVILCVCGLGVLMSAVTGLLLAMRKRFYRLARITQWSLAALFGGLAISATIALYSVIH